MRRSSAGPHRASRICTGVLLLASLSAAVAAQAQRPVDRAIHESTLRGIDSLYNLRFDGALAAFDEAIRLSPDDPRGWFFKSMVSFYIYQLTQNPEAYDRFFELSETVIEKAEDQVDEDDNNLTARFYLGGIYGYRGLAYQRNGSLLSALWDGRKGYGHLREAATGENFAIDARFGFGLFTYLVAKIPSSYSWILGILGFSGDLEGGLEMIRTAADSGIYTRTEASFYYAQFCFFEGRYDTAYAYMQRIMDAYPRNSLFLVTFAAWELRQDRIDEAIEIATRAMEVNRRNEIRIGDEFAHSTLAAAYFAKNAFPEAIGHWERYIELTENPSSVSNYALYRLGISYELLGDRQRALRTWRSMKKSTDEDRAWESVYWRRVQKFLERPLSQTDAMLVIGTNFMQAGRQLDAKEYIDRAIASAGTDPEQRAVALAERLALLSSCRDHAAVVALTPEILRLNPRKELWTVPHSLELLGMTYLALQLPGDARTAFEQALRYEDYDWETRLRNRLRSRLEKMKTGS